MPGSWIGCRFYLTPPTRLPFREAAYPLQPGFCPVVLLMLPYWWQLMAFLSPHPLLHKTRWPWLLYSVLLYSLLQFWTFLKHNRDSTRATGRRTTHWAQRREGGEEGHTWVQEWREGAAMSCDGHCDLPWRLWQSVCPKSWCQHQRGLLPLPWHADKYILKTFLTLLYWPISSGNNLRYSCARITQFSISHNCVSTRTTSFCLADSNSCGPIFFFFAKFMKNELLEKWQRKAKCVHQQASVLNY